MWFVVGIDDKKTIGMARLEWMDGKKSLFDSNEESEPVNEKEAVGGEGVKRTKERERRTKT